MVANKHIRIFVALCLVLAIFSPDLVLGASKKETSASKQEVIDLSFKVLEETQAYVTDDKTDLKAIPENIQSLNGKIVKITGYLLVPAEAYYTDKPITNFAVSKNAYGCPCCSWGDPPTIFNTVVIDMKEGDSIKPPFTPLVEVMGEFYVKKEQFTDEDGQKRLSTLFYIKDAQAKKKKQSLLKSIF